MAGEPGTNWRESFEAYARRKAEEDAKDFAEPPEFVPKCLDCGYDLTGLDDGRCPECGHGFTRKHIFAAYLYRQQEKQRRFSNIRHIPLLIAYMPLFLAMGIETYWGFATYATLLVFGAVLWYLFNRGKFIEGSQWLLILVPPLLAMFIGVTTVEHGVYGMAGVAATIIAICFLALRGSPLLGSIILGGFGVLPLLLFCLWLLLDAYAVRSRGHHWSNFDYPAFPRWRAFTAVQAISAGWVLICLLAVLTLCMAFVAKRSLVRLKRIHDQRRPARPPA